MQDFKVMLPWTYKSNTTIEGVTNWNEICAWTIEQFGLPGDKFRFHPKGDGMEFIFANEKDAVHMILRWS